MFSTQKKREKKKFKLAFYSVLPPAGKNGKAFERVTKHKRKAGRRQYGAEEECDRIVKYTM